jgi:hypothetical protein
MSGFSMLFQSKTFCGSAFKKLFSDIAGELEGEK